MNRRQFLKMLGVALISPVVKACDAIFGTPTATPSNPTITPSQTGTSIPSTVTPTDTPGPTTGNFFNLHPFIEANPEAVFIKRTNVPAKTDTQAKYDAGYQFAREIFVYGTPSGIPLSHKLAIKANVTFTQGMGETEAGMGIVTDVHFTEGVIEGMKALGFQSNTMYLREGNWLEQGCCALDVYETGYAEMGERTGIHMFEFPSGRQIYELSTEELQEGAEVTWREIPGGVVFKRLGYVHPYNQDDSWLLDIAKFKTHTVGMTLGVKNLQGMCVVPHIRFCENVERTQGYPQHVLDDFQPDFVERIAALQAQHIQADIPRWDREGVGCRGGFGMENWAQRTCDSMSVTNVGLSVIEGIYGRNGNAFMEGPGPNGQAQDFMANVLIFGKDPFRTDIIGTWLAGHEPGNFGFFHIARERGLSNVVNPREIPVYLWDASVPQQRSLGDFERVPLLTNYLRKENEEQYHMVDEPFDYRS